MPFFIGGHQALIASTDGETYELLLSLKKFRCSSRPFPETEC